MLAQSRSLFDAPQAIEKPTMLFVPMASDLRAGQVPSRSRVARPAGVALTGSVRGATLDHRERRSPLLLQTAAKAVLKLVQRVFIAEAVLWLTAAICALAGLPAVVTAFFVALVGLVVNLWLAVRTLAPIAGRLFRGRY